MPEIISTPSKGVVEGEDREHHFAYFETQNKRSTQEDALAWHTLGEKQLRSLSPQKIGQRLWTTCKQLDERAKHFTVEAGTTACMTVFDGRDSVITASVGDSVAFLVAYGKKGEVISATRLNSTLHHPMVLSEKERILKAGGSIDASNRINGILSVSRAIGDYDTLDTQGNKLAISDAAVEIASISQLLEEEEEPVSKIQLISTCDGFTDGAEDSRIESQVMYLLTCLAHMDKPGFKTEAEIAAFLAACAIESKSEDNISIAVQTLVYGMPIFLGLYDGHGGNRVAHDAAMSSGEIFLEQCALSQQDYELQSLSTVNNKKRFEKDNAKTNDFIERKSPCFLEELAGTVNEAVLNEGIKTLSLKEEVVLKNEASLPCQKSSTLSPGFFSHNYQNKEGEKVVMNTSTFAS